MKPQQVCGEAVQGADLCFLEVAKCGLCTTVDLIQGQSIRLIELRCDDAGGAGRSLLETNGLRKQGQVLTESRLHLGRRLVGKCKGDERGHRHGIRLPHQRMDEPVDQQGGLSRPGPGDDDHVAIERGRGKAAYLSIGDPRVIRHVVPSPCAAGGGVRLRTLDEPAARWAYDIGGRPG